MKKIEECFKSSNTEKSLSFAKRFTKFQTSNRIYVLGQFPVEGISHYEEIKYVHQIERKKI